MKMNSRIMIIAILAVLFGGVALTTALGLWNTENTRTPARLEKGDAAGAYNPEDIRGSYSFEDVSNLFEIPLDELRTAFGLPEDVDLSVFRTATWNPCTANSLVKTRKSGMAQCNYS